MLKLSNTLVETVVLHAAETSNIDEDQNKAYGNKKTFIGVAAGEQDWIEKQITQLGGGCEFLRTAPKGNNSSRRVCQPHGEWSSNIK